MNADEIVRALRCRKTGKRKCARCPYTAEMSCTEAAMDDAASLIESQQAQLATERTKYAELQRYNVDCTKQYNALLAEKLQLTDRAKKTEYKVTYTCMECGWSGTVQTIGHTVRCPHCGTTNEWWQDGEEPPAAHQIKRLQAQLSESQRREQAAVEDLKEAASELTGIGTCVVCKYGPEEPFDGPHCGKCTRGDCQFEWRGPQEAGT